MRLREAQFGSRPMDMTELGAMLQLHPAVAGLLFAFIEAWDASEVCIGQLIAEQGDGGGEGKRH